MTLTQAIKKYNLQRTFFDAFGDPVPDGHRWYEAQRETEGARYIYSAGDGVSEEEKCVFYLVIESISKTRTTADGRPYMRTKILLLD